MAEHYSPLRYPGGKAALSSFLIEVMRSNELIEPHYIEPYAGGGGAALRLLFEGYVESITINDADPRISSFWRAVTEYNDHFISLIYDAELSVREWRRQRKIYEACDCKDKLSLGFATFYLNRTTRSGIIHNGGPIGGYKQSGDYKIDARFNRDTLARRIRRIGMYSERINIYEKDGIELLKGIGKRVRASGRLFIYLDPPYYVKGAKLYMNRFSHEDHRLLAQYLELQAQFPWIMTYDDVESIRHLYSSMRQKEFYLSYSAYKRRRGKEILIYPDTLEISDKATSALPMAV
ncbi:D12 class N6 adenine-specific DNA methyltransferase [Nitrosococcus halophilus Nc 4]|uniref:D12 class N6 adenine-specific DNA methyltransferase n=1 Tax=Nitrosococcus halophilus (strain Nc4) TaxID=472759 RepID=D5BYV0_NITHN|nr:DNA adenine methylase [Nitrosococcus halophilus]ADE14163.1 D12 class N6 adenine-specific DNA methyltransferase [Nitrosococcus halophilus Nc 4]